MEDTLSRPEIFVWHHAQAQQFDYEYQSEINVIPLFSGSSGNSILIDFAGTTILLDIGKSCKLISNTLQDLAYDPFSLSGILITHEHSDHIAGLDVFVRKYNTSVFATEKTWQGIYTIQKKSHPIALDHIIQPNTAFWIKDVKVTPFSIPHDGRDPVGFRLDYKGFSLGVATDLGYFSPEIKEHLVGCQAVILEANYDPDLLWSGPYPWLLKKRVDGKFGHLPNQACAEAIYDLYKNGSSYFLLAHLSQENNSPSVAMKAVKNFLESKKLTLNQDFFLEVANRFCPTLGLHFGGKILM